MSNFHLNIYTPNGVTIKDLKCNDLTIPTVKGEINVLPGHTHVLAELDIGILTAKTDGSDRHFSMAHGLCKVLGDQVTILAQTSERPEDIDIERAQSARHKAESRLKSNEVLTDVELIEYQRKLHRANTRLRLADRANQQI
jgi:F-type H+-transporting ATPase subunit epsilon